ncbi:reverse transcriptase [Caerostris darwini]|uniref:Reverse transcriptase n=1 Tax=Caerostris darwini TaxID=1538125 RepID=A0AAV4MZG0_9ARAC|nr:reverse transcriptase [Caerostris darwini]
MLDFGDLTRTGILDINLLDTTEELQFYCLQKQEEFVTIKAAERELQHFAKIVKEQELQDFISSQGVTWKFIIERAPWWGGFYERLVKCLKDPLWKNSRTWKIKDVVLMHGTLKSKLLWDLEMIKEVIERSDNLIRGCVVKTAKGLFRKPMQLLRLFELEIS